MSRRSRRSRTDTQTGETTKLADPLCPRCGYCLIDTASPPCPECGYLYDRVDPARLPNMHSDVCAEHKLIRTMILCYLIFLALGAYTKLHLPIDWADLASSGVVAVMLLLGMILFDRSTLSRHERKSRSPEYDGTTAAGTYSMLLIALLAIPILMMLAKIGYETFQRVF
ncbi:MAG: hypothetical protein KDA29_12185 [Phycisphaerales bacterium]|nr:hypothetical protein [Phycisphaerales bacterium]